MASSRPNEHYAVFIWISGHRHNDNHLFLKEKSTEWLISKQKLDFAHG